MHRHHHRRGRHLIHTMSIKTSKHDSDAGYERQASSNAQGPKEITGDSKRSELKREARDLGITFNGSTSHMAGVIDKVNKESEKMDKMVAAAMARDAAKAPAQIQPPPVVAVNERPSGEPYIPDVTRAQVVSAELLPYVKIGTVNGDMIRWNKTIHMYENFPIPEDEDERYSLTFEKNTSDKPEWAKDLVVKGSANGDVIAWDSSNEEYIPIDVPVYRPGQPDDMFNLSRSSADGETPTWNRELVSAGSARGDLLYWNSDSGAEKYVTLSPPSSGSEKFLASYGEIPYWTTAPSGTSIESVVGKVNDGGDNDSKLEGNMVGNVLHLELTLRTVEVTICINDVPHKYPVVVFPEASSGL